MPDSTIPAPVAADPINRLTLGATDPREGVADGRMSTGGPNMYFMDYNCMAEEQAWVGNPPVMVFYGSGGGSSQTWVPRQVETAVLNDEQLAPGFLLSSPRGGQGRW